VSVKWLLRITAAVGLVLIVVPGIDLGVSGLFFRPGQVHPIYRFSLSGLEWTDFAHEAVVRLALVLGLGLGAGFLWSAIRLRPLLGLGAVRWLYLLLALVVGPGLLANVLFKEGWQRARPTQIEQFEGRLRHSPPLVLSNQCAHNCSFVCGDAAVGFFLPTFAYLVAPARRRRVFWAGIGAGVLIGGLRIAMGAHFLSDVFFAAVTVLAASAGLHALMFGRAATLAFWRQRLGNRVAGT
jgi:lipid A 4'-phosphatase